MAEQLARKSILVSPSENKLQLDFVHWGLGDLLTNKIHDETKEGLHLRIAKLLELKQETDKARLARHYEKGGVPIQARTLYIKAAKEAIDAFDTERSTILYEKGIRLYEAEEEEVYPIKIAFASAKSL